MQNPHQPNHHLNKLLNLRKRLPDRLYEMILKLRHNSLFILKHIIYKHLIEHELFIVCKKISLVDRFCNPQTLVLIGWLLGEDVHEILLLAQLSDEVDQLH